MKLPRLAGGQGLQPWAPSLAAIIAEVLDRTSVELVIDVGAHHGEYGRFLRDDVKWRGPILSFEPDPKSFGVLTTAAEGDPDWRVVDVALGAVDSVQQLHRFDRSNFNSLHPPDPWLYDAVEIEAAPAVGVQTLSFSSWLLQQRKPMPLAFLKSDTQGHERQVIGGFGEHLHAVAAMQLELAMDHLYVESTHWTDMAAHCEEIGFRLAGFYPISRRPDLLTLLEADAIFVREGALATPNGPA